MLATHSDRKRLGGSVNDGVEDTLCASEDGANEALNAVEDGLEDFEYRGHCDLSF